MDLIKIIHSEKLYLQRIVNNITAINSSSNWFDYKNSFTNHLSTHLFIHLYSVNMNSIQFKVLFRVDINHTYNTSSNELLKSTIITHTIIHTNILNKNILQFMQFNIDTSYKLMTFKRDT